MQGEAPSQEQHQPKLPAARAVRQAGRQVGRKAGRWAGGRWAGGQSAGRGWELPLHQNPELITTLPAVETLDKGRCAALVRCPSAPLPTYC